MTPRNVAKSGTDKTLLSRVTSAVPMPMPKSATPTGRPMASTDPNATIKMTMANARPSVSDDGVSNSAKMNAALLDAEAVDLRRLLLDDLADHLGLRLVRVVGQLEVGVGDLPGVGALEAIWRVALLGVRADDPVDLVELRDLVEEGLHRRLDLGVVDALVGLEHDGAGLAGALPPKLSSSTSKPRLDSTSGRLKSSRKSLPTTPDKTVKPTSASTQNPSTQRRRSCIHGPSFWNTGGASGGSRAANVGAGGARADLPRSASPRPHTLKGGGDNDSRSDRFCCREDGILGQRAAPARKTGDGRLTQSQDAFAELLATLREVGDRFAGEEWGLTDPADVAEGLRVILHHLGTGIETQFEDDAAHPMFREIVTPWRKALGDNADARYHDAKVHPAGTYRVRGRTGGAVYVSFTVEAGAEDGAFPSGTVGVLNDTELRRRRRRLASRSPSAARRGTGAGCRSPPDASADHGAPLLGAGRSAGHTPGADLGLTIDLVDGDVPDAPAAPTDASVAAAIRRMATYVRSRTLETMAKPGEGEPPAFVSRDPHVFPPPVHAGRPRPRRGRRRLQHGAVPARPRRGAGDAGPLAGVPLRQRVALEPPAPDVRLPPRPGQPQPGPVRRRTTTAPSAS